MLGFLRGLLGAAESKRANGGGGAAVSVEAHCMAPRSRGVDGT